VGRLATYVKGEGISAQGAKSVDDFECQDDDLELDSVMDVQPMEGCGRRR